MPTDNPREALELTPWETMRCAVWYFYNVDPHTQYEAASAEKWSYLHPVYQNEKLADWRKGLGEWFSRFDYERQQRWLSAAIQRYGDDARSETVLHQSMEHQ